MDLKILLIILGYWSVFILVFSVAGGSVLLTTGYSTNANLNTSSLNANETGTGGLFASGISLTRFFSFTLFGLGLPSSVPQGVRAVIFLWQTVWTFFTIGFVISSIWNG